MATSADTHPAYTYLLQMLCNETDAASMAELLDALLTQKEQSELANRIQIFALLQKKQPQRQIASQLGVGIATVSRGAKAYQQHDIPALLPSLSDALADTTHASP